MMLYSPVKTCYSPQASNILQGWTNTITKKNPSFTSRNLISQGLKWTFRACNGIVPMPQEKVSVATGKHLTAWRDCLHQWREKKTKFRIEEFQAPPIALPTNFCFSWREKNCNYKSRKILVWKIRRGKGSRKGQGCFGGNGGEANTLCLSSAIGPQDEVFGFSGVYPAHLYNRALPSFP